MKGSSRALFQAVVVMGAALAACERPTPQPAPREPADVVNPPPGPAAPTPEPPALAPDAAAASTVATASTPPETTQDPTAPEATVPEATAPASKPRKRKRPDPNAPKRCPLGSERPYPPCFYIL